MFRPTISAIIRRYYENIKGETDKTGEEYHSNLKKYIFIPGKNEILKSQCIDG
jgi:hypothetical protein